MGPRQTNGLSPGLSNPTDINFNPYFSLGTMKLLCEFMRGCSFDPIIIGTLGPYTSASSNPTLKPSFESDSARFTATVVLPTPPFPEPTATIWVIPGSGCGVGCAACA